MFKSWQTSTEGLEHGSIPTITIDPEDEISSPNATVSRLLDMASH